MNVDLCIYHHTYMYNRKPIPKIRYMFVLEYTTGEKTNRHVLFPQLDAYPEPSVCAGTATRQPCHFSIWWELDSVQKRNSQWVRFSSGRCIGKECGEETVQRGRNGARFA